MKYISAPELAERLRVNRRTITGLCKSGKLPAVLVNGRWIINLTFLEGVMTKAASGPPELRKAVKSAISDASIPLRSIEGKPSGGLDREDIERILRRLDLGDKVNELWVSIEDDE